MDYARGVAEMAMAIREQRPCRLSAQFVRHVNEVVLGIEESMATGLPYSITSDFTPVEPMDWAGS
jgi:hypothetical protein